MKIKGVEKFVDERGYLMIGEVGDSGLVGMMECVVMREIGRVNVEREVVIRMWEGDGLGEERV